MDFDWAKMPQLDFVCVVHPSNWREGKKEGVVLKDGVDSCFSAFPIPSKLLDVQSD